MLGKRDDWITPLSAKTPERRRMNEASLVANLNPEIEAIQAAQRDRGRAPQLRDTILQRAVDLVTAINFYKSKKQ
jgi:hypothetical protein